MQLLDEQAGLRRILAWSTGCPTKLGFLPAHHLTAGERAVPAVELLRNTFGEKICRIRLLSEYTTPDSISPKSIPRLTTPIVCAAPLT